MTPSELQAQLRQGHRIFGTLIVSPSPSTDVTPAHAREVVAAQLEVTRALGLDGRAASRVLDLAHDDGFATSPDLQPVAAFHRGFADAAPGDVDSAALASLCAIADPVLRANSANSNR